MSWSLVSCSWAWRWKTGWRRDKDEDERGNEEKEGEKKGSSSKACNRASRWERVQLAGCRVFVATISEVCTEIERGRSAGQEVSQSVGITS